MDSKIITNLYNDPNSKNKLLIFLAKLLRNYISDKNGNNIYKIKKILNRYTYESDKIILLELSKIVNRSENLYSEKNNINRINIKWDIIKNHIPNNLKITSLMDFGGNNGDAAHIIGDKLSVDPKNTYSVDVTDWVSEKWSPRSDIVFIHTNKMHDKNIMEDNSVDLIMAMHVLHHINMKEIKTIIKTFDRILSKKGIIILYEHDCNSVLMKNLIDLEHIIFDVVISKKITYEKFIKSYFAEYKTKEEFEKIFSKYFKKYKTIELNNKDNSFYHFFSRK
jgi:2-polyprenyl-3-methyl-5-hydroxy-6-metoxy-1,4-benzoquinol methylase